MLTSISDGLIPAHAGKTLIPLMNPSISEAHPRSRGENVSVARPRSRRRGSSPLTRGKHGSLVVHELADRLIPAHAGKTELHGNETADCEAHPRSRGENTAIARTVTDTMGSSPLTRGKLFLSTRTPIPRRLIPAHAGKTKREQYPS